MDGWLNAVALTAHPAGATTRAQVFVAAAPGGDGALCLDYRLDLPAGAKVAIPGPGDSLPPDRLWQFTCFEAFLARAGAPHYREYNFSPSGQWAGWRFSDYRRRDELAVPAPRLEWTRSAARLTLRASLPASALPPGSGVLQLGLCAVLVGNDGETAYLALAHPRALPDFHDRAAFVLELPG
ncbi:DOMON-like domain-containing protein [Rhodocyclus purpureus]|uniref:DOMON-like domain-containing protein n=1 Tax=Rhodocyclus purpureus TaxID=1067 RepID=UPI001911772B|nr:DOMON-like domain-containing protein [Rhodocyclus purpureus]MBK5915171.1 hypothetical protein [Rhodocyclus purpureus]